MYGIASVPTVAAVIGVGEIVLGVLIAVRPFAPRVSAVGSLGAILMFLTTLELHAHHPRVWQPDSGSRSCRGPGSSWSRT